MTNFAVAVAVAAMSVVMLAVPATVSASNGPWKTDGQAKRYLETQLPTWAGIDLTKAESEPSSYCVNGAYSRHEKRTRRHYGQRIDRNGEPRFRTFSCSLTTYDGTTSHNFELYVQTRPHRPWRVTADR
jgi:hypothetical protein